jgi:sugar lactone lactonase YvrE
MNLATSFFRIARSFSALSQLRKTNVAFAFPVLMALMACPLAHALPSAKYAGLEKAVSTAVANPQAVAVDSNGVVYIADPANHQVLKETPSGLGYATTTIATGVSYGSPVNPSAIAVDASLNVYIADSANNQVLLESWNGSAYAETVSMSGLAGPPTALAIDSAQNIFILNNNGSNWQVVLGAYQSGTAYAAPLVLTTVINLVNPVGIAVDSFEDLFIPDEQYGQIWMATYGTGAIGDNYTGVAYLPNPPGRGTVAGGDGTGIAIDASGSLYILGGDGSEDPLFLETYVSRGVFTESEVASTRLSGSQGVAVGTNGHIYIADSGNNRVIEEAPGSAAAFASVAVGSPSTAATMLFSFSGVQTGISASVLTQGTPGLDFAELSPGTCTSNGVMWTYDTTTTDYYKAAGNLFCAVNVTLTPAFPGGRLGAVALQESGSTIATGYAYGTGTGPQVAFTNPAQAQVDGLVTTAQGIASDAAGNLYVLQGGVAATVVLEPAGGGLSSTVSSRILSGSASGIAVDGAGNVFIANTGASNILEETLTAGAPLTGTYSESVISTGSSSAQGIAVDGSGNLYIADTADNRALKETLSGTTYSETMISASLNGPTGIAVDGAGAVYIADTGHGQLKKETPTAGSYTETTVDSGFSSPSGVAVDGAGNVFVSDSTTSVIVMESMSGGSYLPTTLSNSATTPVGVAVDGVGDVFYVNGTIENLTMSVPPVLSAFGSVQVGSASAAQAFGIENIGNVPLAFAVPGGGAYPLLDADYSVTASGSTTCPVVHFGDTPTPLAPGATCVYSVEFTPSAVGNPLATTIGVIDNTLNATNANQSISLTGVGQIATTAITLGASPTSSNYGDLVTLTATLSPHTGSNSETVAFFDGANPLGTGTLSNGIATLSLSTLPAETASLTAVYSGDTNLVTSTSTALPFTISPVAPAITFSVPNQTYGVAPITVAATSNSAGAFTFALVSGPATVSGTTVTITGSGLVTLSVSQAANGNYATLTQNATFTVAAEVPTISFTVANQTYGVAPVTVAATSASAGAFTYALVSGPATVSGASVTITGSGTVVLSATQAANGSYATATQNASFTVAAETPTISFTVPNQTYGVAPITVGATSASAGAFTYALVSGPATVSGASVTITGSGTVVLSATQAANGSYTTATQNATFTVAAETPAISFTVPNQTYGVAPITVGATSASAGAFTYALVSGPATVSGTTVTITGSGTVVLSATQAANGSYTTATQNATFTVAAETPAISFTVPNQTYGVAPITVGATSASAGAFTYALVSGPATVSGASVTITGSGTVVLSATQAANGNYATGTQNASFTVAAEVPTISFSVANQTYGVAPIAVSATSASLGAFTYALVSGPATVSGATVTVTGSGTVVLSATQAANGSYATATQNASFTVAAEVPAFSFTVANQTYGVAPFAVSATSPSAGAFTYALVSGPATVSGAIVTITGSGTVVLSATQAANGSYTAATQNATFTVVAETPTITFTEPNQTFGVAPITVAATSASGGAFTYAVVSGPATVSGASVTITGSGTVVLSATQAANGSYAVGTQNASFTVATETPTIAFTVPDQTYGAAPITVAATSASAGAFTYALVSGPAIVSGATVTITGSGTVVLSATQAANGSYGTGTQNVSFTVATETPSIAFAVPNQTYGAAPITVGAISASAGTFTYALVSGPATVAGSSVTITGIGTVVLSATQAANGNYATGTQNTSFTVAAEIPAIAFTVPNQTYGAAPITVGATSASSGAFTYALVSGPATVSGTSVTITGSGTVVVSATQAAAGNYAIGSQNAGFTVATETPAITFTVPNQTFGVAPVTVAATSASSGAFTYAVVSGPATVSGAIVTITGSGTVVLSATQAANGSYAAGTQNASFTVAVETPAITFIVPNQTFGVAPFTVAANSASAGAFTYTLVSGPATVAGATVSITGIGNVVLSVSQAANGSYSVATQNASFTVAPETSVLTFAAIATQTSDSIPFQVSATSASAGTVTYAVVSGPATITGSTVTLTGVGTVVLSAIQAAAGNYAAAAATASFPVTAGFTLSATGSSNAGSATVVPGGSAAFVLSLAPGTGTTFPDAMTFSVTGLPTGATATFTPTTILAGAGATTVTLTILTASTAASVDEKTLPGGHPSPLAPWSVALLLPLLGAKRIRGRLQKVGRLSVVLIAAFVGLAAMAGLSGCGSNGPNYPPAQTYTVAVTVADIVTGAHASTNVTLTVQ